MIATRRILFALTALAPMCVFAPSAPAAQDKPREKRVLLDRSLEPHQIKLISISDEVIIYEDDLGRRRQATVGGFVALLPALPSEASLATPRSAPSKSGGAPGFLELTDGQRFPGQPAATGGQGDAMVWSHPLFGRLSAQIDSIARIVLQGSAETSTQQNTEDAGTDQLVLVNGDRLVGFIVSLGDPVEFEADNTSISLPIERIAEASLSNPSRPLSGLVVWLDDGTVAVVASLETTQDQGVSVRLQDGQTATVQLDDVRAIAFAAGRLRPLASLTPTSQQVIGDRRLTDPLHIITSTGADGATDLNTPDIEFPGPMKASWNLPAGVVRLAGVAELPLDSLPWGDCEFVIQLNGVELLRDRLNQNNTRVKFSLPVEAGELVISVEPGEYGPISDRVVLRRPLLLVE